ncbi:MAG: hypothetical protein H7099_20480 [Gemmatimonadaceae bacterium]|nr:hypothetical protein [Gemmatimonadaceae bacterium]
MPTLVLVLLQPCVARGADAQARDGRSTHTRATRDSVSAMATALVTHVAPAVDGRARTDALLTQPMIALRSSRAASRLQLSAMLNFEHITMPDGEPVAGIWGEGFIDRRHPHTLLHEAMLTANAARGALRASIGAGRGFAPFGTDDPMVRPFTKFPANHHLAQVMERVQVLSAVRVSRFAAVEAALFNGDEPASPTAAPQWKRFADSHAERLTIWPTRALEVQGSMAWVRSPEFIRPDGLDHRKRSISARVTPQRGALEYALVEWARTGEEYRGRPIVAYASVLAEASWRARHWFFAARGEQTTRPEDERLLEPFRISRPPNHLVIQGVTRWRIATVHVARDVPGVSRVGAGIFGEVSRAQSSPRLRPVLLDPRNISGADVAWHLTLGLRLSLGAMPARIGRYGAAACGAATDRMPGMAHPSPAHDP